MVPGPSVWTRWGSTPSPPRTGSSPWVTRSTSSHRPVSPARARRHFKFGTSGNLAGATIAAFDTPTAQELLMKGQDVYTSIDVAAAEGVTQESLAAEVKAAVGPGVQVQTGEEAADQATQEITEGLGFFNSILVAFSLVSLFVGAFLIVNTFSMLVSQRTKELALLRAVGATRGQIVRSVLAESAVVGLIASLIGCVFGIAVTMLLSAGFGAIGIEMGDTPLVLAPSTFVIGIGLGVGITVISAVPRASCLSYPPGRRSARRCRIAHVVTPSPRHRRWRAARARLGCPHSRSRSRQWQRVPAGRARHPRCAGRRDHLHPGARAPDLANHRFAAPPPVRYRRPARHGQCVQAAQADQRRPRPP